MTQPDISLGFRVDRPFASEVSEVAASLGTDAGGLTADEAAARLDTVGPNLLPEHRLASEKVGESRLCAKRTVAGRLGPLARFLMTDLVSLAMRERESGNRIRR